jgi:hypothetical protein
MKFNPRYLYFLVIPVLCILLFRLVNFNLDFVQSMFSSGLQNDSIPNPQPALQIDNPDRD